MNPTRTVQLWVSILSSLSLLASIALALGSTGKRRIQFASFGILSAVFYFGLGFKQLPFSFASALSRNVLERAIESTKPSAAPDGSLIYLAEDGRYMIRRVGKDFEPIAKSELEENGLIDYAYTDMTARSSDALEGIYDDVVALCLGLLGFVLSGFAYDRRILQDQREH